MKMWSCFDNSTIKEKIQKTVTDQLSWTFWQSEVKGQYKFIGRISELTEDRMLISLSVGSLDNIFRGESIYGHCDQLDIIFKRDKFEIIDGLIRIPFPNELKIKDIRLIDRLYYKYQDYKAVTFNCFLGDKEQTLSYIMSDLSTKGVSFVAPKKDVENFEKDLEVSISHISDQELTEVIPAKVVYLAPFGEEALFKSESDHGKLTKVGVIFDEGLDEVVFKTVAHVIEQKQKKLAGLDVKGFNGLKPEEIDRKLAFISEADPKLSANISSNIEQIERLRFLTPRMKQMFWTEVDRNILARALRISSKELLFDLLSDVSENVRMDFLESLDNQISAGVIEQSQVLIIQFIHEKERTGKFVLSPDSFVKYV